MSAMNFDEFKDKVFAAALSIGCEAAEAFYVESERFTVRILEQETDSYSVSRSGFVLRSKIGYPTFFSIRFTVALRDGCEINNFAAAFEKLFSRYTS